MLLTTIKRTLVVITTISEYALNEVLVVTACSAGIDQIIRCNTFEVHDIT